MTEDGQPIETVQKAEGGVIVWDGEQISVARWEDGRWYIAKDWMQNYFLTRPVTHWMHLPSPPKQES